MSMNFQNSLQGLPEIKKLLKSLKAVKTEYNTTNGWGFAGLAGHQWKLPNGDLVIIADVCYRHIDGYKVCQYRKLVGDYSELNNTDYYKTIIDTPSNTDEIIKELNKLI